MTLDPPDVPALDEDGLHYVDGMLAGGGPSSFTPAAVQRRCPPVPCRGPIMRRLALLLVPAFTAPVPAALPAKAAGGAFIYVSVAGEKRIAVYRMDRVTGGLTHKGDAKLDGEPGALAVDPGRRGQC
jgi:hypothetical protein